MKQQIGWRHKARNVFADLWVCLSRLNTYGIISPLPDALALGRTAEELRELEPNVPDAVLPHRIFEGNRPSVSLLFPRLTAYTAGQLLALYEHRTVVQGFIWNINSFDQWGVELGTEHAFRPLQKLGRGK